MSPKAARQILAILPPDPPESREVTRARAAIAKSPGLLGQYEEQLVLDRVAAAAFLNILIPENISAELSAQANAITAVRGGRRFSFLDPAMLSVTIGFLLLVATLTWHFLGRVGVFPEEALSIATEGAKLRTEQFEVVEDKAGSLEDWFILKGFDRFYVPGNFANFQAAGARVFKISNQPVAVLAIPENFMFFLIFDPAPFGIVIRPAGAWQFAEFDYKYAAAIREERGMCFMVVIKGTPQDLKRLIEKKP
ncbi:MAG: hypothetical protein ACOYM3_01780 [Terrimicrobiaceae bacterium]